MATGIFVVLLCGPLLGQCWGQDLVLRTPEEIERGTYIGNVSDIKDMFRSVSTEEKRSMKFGIIDKNNQPTDLFRIDTDTGKIYTDGRIDREALCDYTESCRVEFDVAVHSPSTVFSNVATVHVYIDDINDNSPTFPATEVTLNVSEIASVGAVLKISGAVDRDSMVNNTIQSYKLSTHNDLFTLTTTRNLDGSSVINLLLQQVLDHEAINKYMFKIIALDGGTPPKSGVLVVTINVMDENDNPPQFLNSTYNVVVKEDAPINSTILVVSAVDPDLGKNGRVRYQFSNLQSSKMQSLFTIDSENGVIRVANRLEYNGKPHQLIVEAQDSGDTPLKTQTVITVSVVDTGNNSPVVKINTLAPGGSVSEAAGVGFFVAVVEVEDSDTGDNGDVVCSLLSTAFSLEPLSGKNRYKVLVNSALDHENIDSYNISVLCQDKGSPPLSSSAVFQMRVTDVNDNDPVFQKSEYNVSLQENSAIGYSVLSLSATDADSGQNAQLRYFVVENSQTPSFRIQHETGIITTNRKFDRELEQLVQFIVLVIDQGSPARTGTARVTLYITDVNDMFPAFTHQLFQFQISENMNANTIVGTISALDKDVGLNSEVEYFIAESPDGIIPFDVMPNGTIIAKESLDREGQSKYIFTVLARDKGSPPKTNSSEVSITVLDENDNIPSILFPTTYNHTVLISRPPESDAVIGKIVAYDGDFGENSSLSFNITAGNSHGVFAIDKENGETKVAGADKLENGRVYDLTISVQDAGNPPKMNHTHLIIHVEFDNQTSVITTLTQNKDKYVVIAAVVASATIILSIIIIAAICFVLRSDPHKSFHQSLQGSPRHNCTAIRVKTQTLNEGFIAPSDDNKKTSQASSVNKMGVSMAGTDQLPYRKKEVSFSMDESLDCKPHDLFTHNSKLTILDERNRVLHLDDMQSDTSGETIPSDSGRGGSEEEANFHSDNKPAMKRTNRSNPGGINLSLGQSVTETVKLNSCHVPSKQKPVQFVHTNRFQEERDVSRRSCFANLPQDYSLHIHCHNKFQDKPHEFTRQLTYGRQSSRVSSHDDDGSTTTSGSYTINQEDFSVEDRILGKDVIV